MTDSLLLLMQEGEGERGGEGGEGGGEREGEVGLK